MSAPRHQALAETGGAALAAAMGTGSWAAARSGLAQLFARHEPAARAAIEAQLDANAAAIARVRDGEHARRLLAELWRLELAGLLDRRPAASADLAIWASSTRAALPPSSQAWTQTNTAHYHGIVHAVLLGNQYNHYMDSPLSPPGNQDCAGSEAGS